MPSAVHGLSVVENLKILKGEDEKISSMEEADAIIHFVEHADDYVPYKCSEDNIRLFQAYQSAHNYKKGYGNLLSYIIKGLDYVIDGGKTLYAKISKNIKDESSEKQVYVPRKN